MHIMRKPKPVDRLRCSHTVAFICSSCLFANGVLTA